MKTSLVYDWLVTMGGGEKTLAAIHEIYPGDFYTLVHDPKKLQKTYFQDKTVHTSFIQHIPFAKSKYRNYLPLFPIAIEQFDLNDSELILSTSHAVAKGVITHPAQLHLCYCLTPVRYAWDLTHRYLEGIGGVKGAVARASLHYLRNWDISSLSRVDHFASISHYVAKRVKKIYGRESEVIYPPVDIESIPFKSTKEGYYLTVSRFVPYKKIDLLVQAFAHLPNEKLIVVGDGPEMKKIKACAGKNVEILGWQSDQRIRELMSNAKAFLFAADEDFGIVVVEAQAAGTPVIAYGKGAALETVVSGVSGKFFQEQSVDSVVDAIKTFACEQYDPEAIRAHAMKFSKDRFKREFKQFVQSKIEEFYEVRHSCGR